MSVAAPSLIAPRQARTNASEHHVRRRGVSMAAVESLVIWGVAVTAYALLGDQVVLHQHVVNFDAASRLAHGFFVWYNAPPKLAAIGFVWPPVMTLVFLPLAAIKPLATSLLALPLTSAIFAAALLVVLDRTLALLEIRWPGRYAIVAAFGVNPMIADYGSNGMGELVYLCFLMAGIYLLLRWYLSRNTHFLVLASVPFALAILTRYELVAYVAIAALAVAIVLRGRRAAAAKREAALIGYLLPIVYVVGLWTFFNWLIMDDALFWLRNQAPGAAGQQTMMTGTGTSSVNVPLGKIAHDLLSMNLQLFPFAVVLVVVLVAVWLRRRDVMTACLIAMMLANAATTVALILLSNEERYLQLRYNMRAMPIAVVAAGWVIYTLRSKIARTVATLAVIAGLLASIPVTWHAMSTYTYQYEESAFIEAISTGKDMEGTVSMPGNYHIGIREERQMADYILKHVDRRNAILTDDSQSLEVMLFSGRPDLFLDRIDYGDTAWLRVLNHPFGQVQYFLLSTYPLSLDLIQYRFTGIAKGVPWAKVVYANGRYQLLAIPRCPPADPGFGLLMPARCRTGGTR